jgi:hypothetical protein
MFPHWSLKSQNLQRLNSETYSEARAEQSLVSLSLLYGTYMHTYHELHEIHHFNLVLFLFTFVVLKRT